MPASPSSTNTWPPGPRLGQRGQLAPATDQARRPLQADRHRSARRGWRGRLGALDGCQQRQGLLTGPRPQLVLEAPFTALEGVQRCGAVAAQVVQPRHAARRVLGQGLFGDEALRELERAGQFATRLVRRRLRGHRFLALRAPPRALQVDPGGQVGAVPVLAAGEQRALVSVRCGAAGSKVDVHVGQELQAIARVHELVPVLAAQSKDALAQAARGRPRRCLGPEQRSQLVAPARALERQQRQQCGVLAFERVQLAAGTAEGGRAEQVQAEE
jgi:hypothetical protein